MPGTSSKRGFHEANDSGSFRGGSYSDPDLRLSRTRPAGRPRRRNPGANGAAGGAKRHSGAAIEFKRRATKLVDLLRRLFSKTTQPADADHSGKRQGPDFKVGVSITVA